MTDRLHIYRPATTDLETGEAARTNVALFDLSDRTQIEITGSERGRFLHGFTSNNINRLKPGQGCETFVTNLKGKVVAHVFVFCAQDSLWLDGTPGQQDAILSHLGKYLIIEDVQLIPRSHERGELFVTGPLSGQLLQLNEQLAVCGHLSRETAGDHFEIRRVDLLGVPGYLMSIPKARIEAVKEGMLAVGVPEGSPELFDCLRIEAGFPNYGRDITDDNLAQEVGRTKSSVSFDKGCYLGQETIARIDAVGHTNRELKRLRFASNLVPEAGCIVLDAEGATEIGTITSAARDLVTASSDGSFNVFALGMIKRIACAANTPVKIRFGDQVVAGQVI